jgi:hypothetical protein
MDRDRWRDEKTNRLTADNASGYGGIDVREDVVFSGIFVEPARRPADLPEDHQAFWNYVGRFETRSDAREAQGMIADFPDGLTQQQREYMLKDFIHEQFMRKGYAVHAVIHRPSAGGDSRNYHAHLLWPLREITPNGFGKRLPDMTPQRIRQLRQAWADLGAGQLERSGKRLDAERHRASHLSLAAQHADAVRRKDFVWAEQCDREATRHEGPIDTAKRRNGESTERTRRNDAIRARNHISFEKRAARKHIVDSQPRAIHRDR